MSDPQDLTTPRAALEELRASLRELSAEQQAVVAGYARSLRQLVDAIAHPDLMKCALMLVSAELCAEPDFEGTTH